MWDLPTAESTPSDFAVLTGPSVQESQWSFLVQPATGRVMIEAYRRLRRETFVVEQGLFTASDRDDVDDDPPRTVVLVAISTTGEVLGGVRLAPMTDGTDLGWWVGSRLVVGRNIRSSRGIGKALVRAACAHAESRGALRFDATVQSRNETMFAHLGWTRMGDVTVAGAPHVHMTWPIDRVERLVQSTKSCLAHTLAPLGAHGDALGGAGSAATTAHRYRAAT